MCVYGINVCESPQKPEKSIGPPDVGGTGIVSQWIAGVESLTLVLFEEKKGLSSPLSIIFLST